MITPLKDYCVVLLDCGQVRVVNGVSKMLEEPPTGLVRKQSLNRKQYARLSSISFRPPSNPSLFYFPSNLISISIMTLPLLKLPPEILLQILSNLSIQPLLRFAQTSHYACSLAYTDLKALSLAICPSHRASWHNKLFIHQHKPAHNLHAAVQIPQACDFNYPTLLTFHNKLIAGILRRHASTLQKLELTVWTLSPPIASAIVTLPALKELSIRLDSTQAMPRAYTSLQRREEVTAWDLLAATPSWTYLLQTLQIANAELSATQLLGITDGATGLRDLRLSSCEMLTSSIWDAARFSRLHRLGVTDCANVHVNETAVEAISKMRKLQVRQSFLDIRGKISV